MSVLVAYPGTVGSFSCQAARSAFPEAELMAYASFEETTEALASWKVDYALLPIENSSAGAVAATYELLEKKPVHIVGEVCRAVRHQLLGIPGSSLDQIRTISSHPHAIAQCDAFLAKMKGVQIVPSLNTAISARDVSEKKDPGYAAIASIDAAKEYHLAVLAKDIQTAKQNTTRFFILSMDAQPLDVPDKATVIFRIANVVGALAKVLTSFAQSGLNMTRIESRPIPDRPFQYMFLVDFGGIMDRTQVRQAMEKAKMFTEELRLLGMYPGARLQEAERDDKKSEVLGRNPIA